MKRVRYKVRQKIFSQMEEIVDSQVIPQVWEQVRRQVQTPICPQTGERVWDQIMEEFLKNEASY